MVVRCSHCQGMMRLDEKSLPATPRVKIRCPHCQGVGYIEHPPEKKPPKEAPPVLQPDEQAQGSHPQPKEHIVISPEAKYDVSMPHDAFKDFRFPAEQDLAEQVADARSRKPVSKRLKILLWVIASVGVVALFALIVNIVLPGPSGSTGAMPEVQQEEQKASPKTGRGNPSMPSGQDSRPQRPAPARR